MFGRRLVLLLAAAVCFCQICLVLLQKAVVSELQVKRVTGEQEMVYNSSYCQCQRVISVRELKVNPEVVWCSREASLRGNHQKIIAYSLFGNVNKRTSKYWTSLMTIAAQAKKLYPGWRLRIHHNIRSVNSAQRHLLCQMYCQYNNVDLCDMKETIGSLVRARKRSGNTAVSDEQISHLNRLIWRYLPMMDPQVDVYMSRDSDSEIIVRESAAVRQWLLSNRTFHIIRDHQGHLEDILGGLFGAKVHQRRDLIQGLTKVMVHLGKDVTLIEDRALDQVLLSQLFWPIAKDDAVIHDSFFCEIDWNSVPVSPFPTQRVNLTFVSDRTGADWPRPSKCPVSCRPVQHPDWEYC